MNQAQQRKTMREMMSGPNQKTTSDPVDLPYTDEYSSCDYLFNDDAKQVFAQRANNLLYQYNETTCKWPQLENAIELLGLLGLKSAQDNPVTNTFIRQIAQVRFFGFVCDKADLPKAKIKLIDAINDMAINGWLKASLCNLGSIELATSLIDPSIKGRAAIFSYVAIKHNCETVMRSTYGNIEFKEGGTPVEFI